MGGKGGGEGAHAARMLPSDVRVGEAERIVRAALKSDRVPLHFTRREGCFLPHLDPAARLARPETSMASVLVHLRKEMRLERHQAMIVLLPFLRLPPSSATVAQVHAECAGEDGLLRLLYSSEEAFG